MILRIIFPLLLSLIAVFQTRADSSTFTLETVRPDHPRILASAADFDHIRDAQWDDLGKRYLSFLRQTGQNLKDQPPIAHRLDGKRLLQQSRKFLKRISTWALLYRVYGDETLRDRAIEEMEIVAAFPDWNPQHYLDVGEMTLAIAIGVDWFWDDLSVDQRNRFLDVIEEKGIRPSLDETHPDNWWLYYNNNWNPVCHAGLVAGALLLVERNPELAERVVARAIKAAPRAMDETDPDGIYPEGPVYWTYGAHFTAVLINLLEHACGSSFGLAEHQSFQESINFRSHAVTPTGSFYNFYDNGKLVRFEPITAYYASRYNSQVGFYEMKRGLEQFLENNQWDPADSRNRNLPMLALWYPKFDDTQTKPQLDLPNSWKGDGPNPVAFIRERWNDPNAFFLGFKGGKGSISHAHMDAGSFIFEDEGIRWAIDLDPQAYLSLESKGLGIWDRRQHSDRWRVFRIGPHSHNLLLIDQRLQDVEASASIIDFSDTSGKVKGAVELSEVYQGQATRYTRRFIAHDYKVLQITDTIEGARNRTDRQGRKSGTLRWRMLTQAKIDIEGKRATLHQDGKALSFHVVAPKEFTLRAESLETPRHYWDMPNPGVNAIDLWTKTENSGDQKVTILMSTDEVALAEVADSI